jgi:hypothetical protein
MSYRITVEQNGLIDQLGDLRGSIQEAKGALDIATLLDDLQAQVDAGEPIDDTMQSIRSAVEDAVNELDGVLKTLG